MRTEFRMMTGEEAEIQRRPYHQICLRSRLKEKTESSLP
jgi:hypothetical protein